MATGTRTPYQMAARELLRTTLLESARALLRERRWSAITMAEIAAGAGVSRQTLYNEFGSRTEFVQSFVLHDADRILSAVESAISDAGGDPRATIEHAFHSFLELIVDDPLAISVLSGDDPDNVLRMVTTQGGPVLDIAATRLGDAISATWPAADPSDVARLSKLLVRTAISHAMLPDGDDRRAAARDVADLLTPFAERALGIG